MSVVEPGPASSGLIQRVQDILLRPKPTWDVIDVEPATVQGLFTSYAAILAAIPAVAGLIGGMIFTGGLMSPVWLIVMAVVGYVLSLVMVFVVGLIIDALAPSFDGQKNQVQAMKVAVYPYTAAWVAGILQIFPPLAPLVILASLYGLYLLYLGLPKLMKVPQEKALGYTIVTVIVAIVMSIIIGAVIGSVTAMSAIGAATLSQRGPTVEVGDAKVNVMAAAKQMEQAAKQIEAGATGEGVAPVDVEVLKAHLPNAVAGFARTEVSTGSGGVGGISGSSAEGKYQKGDARIT
ncbi:MAG: YIP1 family protein, partial [Caulobacteraceae bacterium]|nr:YIP1 family protein [Caulobacteraceae bacterium]